MRRTDCEGGSPRVRYTTARFRHPARRRSRVAARRTRAAAGQAQANWFALRESGFNVVRHLYRIHEGHARAGLCRGKGLRHRVALTEGQYGRLSDVAAELARLNVDV